MMIFLLGTFMVIVSFCLLLACYLKFLTSRIFFQLLPNCQKWFCLKLLSGMDLGFQVIVWRIQLLVKNE